MLRTQRPFIVLDRAYKNSQFYVLKSARITYDKNGHKIWYTRITHGPTKLIKFLISTAIKIAKEKNARLLVGIKHKQSYKMTDIRKEYDEYELYTRLQKC